MGGILYSMREGGDIIDAVIEWWFIQDGPGLPRLQKGNPN